MRRMSEHSLEQALKRLVKEARFRLGSARQARHLHRRIDELQRESGIGEQDVAWILSAGRTGSSWLAAMMEDAFGLTQWFEPRIGNFFDREWMRQQGGRGFVFHRKHEREWLPAVRAFILTAASARFPRAQSLVIKETGGSMNADILLGALSESKAVLLPRDPRDVCASWQDAYSEGGWRDVQSRKGGRSNPLAKQGPDEHARRRAENYVRVMEPALRAFEAHEGPKVSVSYEELVEDTEKSLTRIATSLGYSTDNIEKTARAHSFENMPSDKQGAGKFYRKGKAGTYHEDLAPEQIRIVEEVCGPLMKELGYS